MENIKHIEEKIDALQASFDSFIKFFFVNYPQSDQKGQSQALVALYERERDKLLKERRSKEKK